MMHTFLLGPSSANILGGGNALAEIGGAEKNRKNLCNATVIQNDRFFFYLIHIYW